MTEKSGVGRSETSIPTGGYSICEHGIPSYRGPCPECPKRDEATTSGERWMPTPCDEHQFSSSVSDMAACVRCDFRGQAITEAVKILDGHPGLQPWEPPVLAEAILVAVGMIERAP